MVSEEELKKAIIDIMKDSNDLESAKTIFEAVAIDNYYITTGRVNIVKVAMKCILEYLNNPRNLNITETRREMVKLKEIEKSHKEENGKLKVELEQEKEKNKELEAKRIWNKLRIEELKKELVQEKEKNKELEEKLKIAKQLYNDACVCIATDCVEKDKIKELLENEIIDISGFRCIAVEDIENLLEDK